MLITVDEAKKLIESGKAVAFAGDENLLKHLPKGNWIGGSIPYFMDKTGGISTKDKVFADEILPEASVVSIKNYAEAQLEQIPQDASVNGFSLIIIPASTNVHLSFAENALNYQDIFVRPLIGWISGVNLNDLGKVKPTVYDGNTQSVYTDKAVVMHCSLPSDKLATIGIINLFKQGAGDSIVFDKTGFSEKDCYINGKKMNFAEYLLSNKIDTKLPLVSDNFGTMVNVSFQQINEKEGSVDFYAPVFSGIEYKIAAPVDDYVKAFTRLLPKDPINSVFSCNCILNYLYSELEGKKTGNLTGPMTFGEIAYQLLNQTLVYLEVQTN